MISEKEYYSKKRVSSSSLKWFEFSPKYFMANLQDEIKRLKMSWLELGRQIHMSILEPLLFKTYYTYLDYTTPKSKNQLAFCEAFVKYKEKNQYNSKKKNTIETARILAYKDTYTISNKSDEKIDKESETLYKSLKDYIKYLQTSKDYREILSKSKWELIENLKDNVIRHKKAKELLTNEEDLFGSGDIEYLNEHIILWEYPDGDYKVPCKSMLDRLVIDHKNKVVKLIDVKTTSGIGDFKDHFEHYKYHRQLAFYWMAVYYEFGKKIHDYKKETYIVALQTKELPECKVFSISENSLTDGLDEIENLMSKISWHYQNESWEYSKEYYEGNGAEILK